MLKRSTDRVIRIRTVEALAFVAPVFDYRDVNDLMPCEHEYSVGYGVYKIDLRSRAFKFVDFFDLEEEARALAAKIHNDTFDKLGSADRSLKTDEPSIPSVSLATDAA